MARDTFTVGDVTVTLRNPGDFTYVFLSTEREGAPPEQVMVTLDTLRAVLRRARAGGFR